MTKARDLANASTALSAVSATELGYVDGVTSAIQTQIDTKLATATAATTYVANSLADAKGDLLTATADNTPARLAVGNNGETLVADSSTSTGLRYQGTMAAGRNFVINGGMDIWQRGTSKLDGANTYGTADRWVLSSATAVTFSRQATGDTTNLPFVQYCMRVQRTSASTSTSAGNISQSFETVNSIPLAGKTVTLSFYARKGADYSATSSILTAYLYTGTGTDQNVYTAGYTGSVTAINQNATLTATWQRFSYTATLAGSATEIGINFIGAYTGTASTNDYYEITGIQLEVGSVATQFSRAGATIQGELAACQRYYQRINAVAAYSGVSNWGNAWSTTIVDMPIPILTQLRTSPTSVETSNIAIDDGVTTFTGGTFTISTQEYSTQVPIVRYTHGSASLTTYRSYHILAANNSSAYLGLSAEL